MLDVTDTCDPSPTVTFLSGTSNQPDNGTGDGNTTDDFVVKPESVCARAERQGMVLDGRTYTIQAQVADAAGNKQDVSFAIDVPHDQSAGCGASGGARSRTTSKLQIGSASPELFGCTTGALTLPTPMLMATSGGQSEALDNAAAMNKSGHYTY